MCPPDFGSSTVPMVCERRAGVKDDGKTAAVLRDDPFIGLDHVEMGSFCGSEIPVTISSTGTQ
jgi:hypothetical protein